MIVWREKFKAFGLHFIVTLLLAAAAAALIFLVWFPDPLQTMLGGWGLFVLVVGCDLALGPLMSLVIYNSRKARRLLILDYTIVGAVQLAALGYGIYIMSSARPVYIAFATDQFEVVAAADIAEKDLRAGKDPFRSLPLTGPKLIGTRNPTDPHERSELLLAAFEGRDVQFQPRYYVPYETQVELVKKKAQPIARLRARHPQSAAMVAEVSRKFNVREQQLGWLNIRTPSMAFWTAVVDMRTALPIAYLPIDPD